MWELTRPCPVQSAISLSVWVLSMQQFSHAVALVASILSFALFNVQPTLGRVQEQRIKQSSTINGVAVSHRKDGEFQYVVGRIRIHQPPERVWPILANPFEFEQKISQKFKTVQILTDKPDVSVLKCRVDMGFLLPPINYTVESRYEARRKVTFHSLAGDLKEFRGTWEVEPVSSGNECDVIYSMYCQPGIPVPQWLVRQCIKFELPHTLNGLKNRVDQVYIHNYLPASRRLASSGIPPV